MAIFLALITGLVVWVVLWAMGAKGFDAMLITLLMLVVAAATRLIVPHLPGNRRQG